MNKELLFSITRKDFEVQTFRSGGKGGQHQNKTDSGVRIIHKDSGAVAESRSERSQYQNKKIALRRLVKHPKFILWMNQKVFDITSEKSIDERVDEQMKEENIIVEYLINGEWTSEQGDRKTDESR